MHASSQIVNYAFHSRLSALLRKAPTLTGAYNTAYTLRADALALRDIAPFRSQRRICWERYTQFHPKTFRMRKQLKIAQRKLPLLSSSRLFL